MITIYSTPKAWDGEMKTIQRNAVLNWKHLGCKVVLLADDEGTAEAANQLGVKHIPDINRSEHGTPLVSSIFEAIHEDAETDLVAYVNCDIILFTPFKKASLACSKVNERFLMVGRRWNMELNEEVNYNDPNWEKSIRRKMGKAEGMRSRDYFVFAKDMFENVPDFALGRGEWDSWLAGEVLKNNEPMIDASNVVRCAHQNHDFGHLVDQGVKIKRGNWKRKGIENENNLKLVPIDHPSHPKLANSLTPTHGLRLQNDKILITKYK